MQLLGPHPGRRVLSYYLLVIMLGAIALSFPFSEGNHTIGFLDALFTSTSAVCVTGLIVVDTGSDFSFWGQVIILILIQIGGLGIMTFTTLILISLGSRLTLHERLSLSQTLESKVLVRPGHLILAVLSTSLIVEGIGAFLIYLRFQTFMPHDKAVFNAIFHSVSAFCNAGFSTFSDSLESFQGDYPLLLVFSSLIILGGLGFIVIRELITAVLTKKIRLSLHSKICLSATGFLILAGTVTIFASEFGNLVMELGLTGGLVNSFFQAVTARTAGFNSVPQTSLTEVSLLITIILMFIGACPGSCAGGIKTTTAAIIFIVIYKRFMGRMRASIFRKSISRDSITNAFTVFHLSIIIVLIALSVFLFTESVSAAHIATKGWFLENMFEIFSAFGTVGLSLGITGSLHDFGKVIIIVMMFIGRVGLLTLAFSLARPLQKGEIVYAEEQVMVG